MLKINKIHHVAIICADYQKSKKFYTKILGFNILTETYREARDSYMLELGLDENYVIELFSFPNPPKRLSRPEARGLRHLAFEVDDVTIAKAELETQGVICEEIRIDEYTDKMYMFFEDPDKLPLELYQK